MASELLGSRAMQALRLLGSATLLATLGVLAGACSSNDSGSSTVDGACAEYASAINTYTTRCGGSTRGLNESRMKAACLSALSLNGSSITPQTLSSCANAVKSLTCGSDLEDTGACNFPPGKLADGTSCVSDEQCASENCKKVDNTCGVCSARIAIGGACESSGDCVDGARCTAGKCVAEIRNPVGGSCDATKGEYCQSGLYCDYSTKICKAYGAAGAACSLTMPCGSGLTCDATSKTCVAVTLAAEGQACSTSLRCQSGLACDPTAAKCVKVTIVAPGGDCGGSLQVCQQGSCNETTKKCPTIIPDGGACGTNDPSKVCDAYASCVDGKCALLGQVVCK